MLAKTFPFCSNDRMARLAPDPALVATATQAIATSPGWVRVSLTVGNDHLREAAILELASSVVDSIQNPPTIHSPDQLRLAL